MTANSNIKKQRKPAKQKLKQHFNAFGYLFLLPWMLGFVIFVGAPLLQSFFYALNDVRVRPSGNVYRYIGLKNFSDVFLKDLFWGQELGTYLISILLKVPVILIFSLIIAVLLNSVKKLKGLLRTIFFLPVIIVSGPIMAQLTSQGATSIPSMNQELISNMLNSFLPTFIASPIIDLFAQLIVILWYSGVQILIFIAALQKVDPRLYEAAKIDGGSAWECFWKITLPIIKPITLLNAIYTVVTLSNSDDNAIIQLIYNNMFDARRGYGFASAMAWMYSVVVLFLLCFEYLLLREHKTKEKHAFVMKGRGI